MGRRGGGGTQCRIPALGARWSHAKDGISSPFWAKKARKRINEEKRKLSASEPPHPGLLINPNYRR